MAGHSQRCEPSKHMLFSLKFGKIVRFFFDGIDFCFLFCFCCLACMCVKVEGAGG